MGAFDVVLGEQRAGRREGATALPRPVQCLDTRFTRACVALPRHTNTDYVQALLYTTSYGGALGVGVGVHWCGDQWYVGCTAGIWL